MFATCCRKIAGKPISAAGKLSLARAGFSAQSYQRPPRPPKPPRFPSMPNSIEGELRWKYEEYRASHEKFELCYTKSELSVHGEAAGQTFDFNYLSTDDLVILKGDILPDVVAFAQTCGCSVSTWAQIPQDCCYHILYSKTCMGCSLGSRSPLCGGSWNDRGSGCHACSSCGHGAIQCLACESWC